MRRIDELIGLFVLGVARLAEVLGRRRIHFGDRLVLDAIA